MQQKDNSGVLFKNDKRESDNHPNYKGSAMVDGSEYWLSAWVNKSKNGQMYMSVSLTPRDNQQQQSQPSPQQGSFDDDIQF